MEAKIELRRVMKERLGRMSDNERRVESQIIVRELRKLMPEAPCVIAAYYPYIDEPNITPLLNELLEQKNVICLGKMEGTHMTMHRIRSLESVGRNPVSTLIEPLEEDPIDESTITRVIIPGRAFTRDGLRMGRGNGGYDRWIERQMVRNPTTTLIGVCFDCQLLIELPMQPHDRPVDTVISPSGQWTRKQTRQ